MRHLFSLPQYNGTTVPLLLAPPLLSQQCRPVFNVLCVYIASYKSIIWPCLLFCKSHVWVCVGQPYVPQRNRCTHIQGNKTHHQYTLIFYVVLYVFQLSSSEGYERNKKRVLHFWKLQPLFSLSEICFGYYFTWCDITMVLCSYIK